MHPAEPSRDPGSRLREVRALFERLVDLPEERRRQALAEARAQDAEAAAQAEALLAAHERADSLFDTPVAGRAGLAPLPNLEGRMLGAYRLVRKVGEGGMGEVYEAVRMDAAFEKRVAVKVIRGGVASPALVERFQQERRILAALEHPGITRITDGGVTEDGSPYLVMDYVAGVPIDRYCRENAVTPHGRLRLFARVCEAVQHAHRHLVVHRDIKPANILVTAEGEPKLLDFGIAKVLQGDATVVPVTGSLLLMTPDYASPEQILGRPVTTATDVYLLGVLLFELLTDRHPHRRPGVPTHEVMRAICEDDPARPGSLAKDLPSDLDHVVLKALSRDPARRYPTVDALQDDLFRLRHHLPVQARRPTLVYRGARFVQRNRLVVAAAALVAAALTGGLLLSRWQARKASEQARRAEAVTSLLTDIFRRADAGEAGRQLSAREVIDLGAQRIEAGLRGQPDLQAEMSTLLGQVYTGIGAYDRAAPLLRRAVDLRRGGTGGEGELAAALDAYGRFLGDTGDEAAEQTLRDALAIRERALGPSHALVGATLSHLGHVLNVRSKYPEARAAFERAIAVQRAALGALHGDVADSMEGLADTYVDEGDVPRATALHAEVLALRRRVLGPDHPDVLRSVLSRGTMAFEGGDYAVTESAYREALELGSRTLEPDHPFNLASLYGIATVLAHQGRYPEAEPLLRDVLARRGRRFGPRNPQLIDVLDALGTTVLRLGRAEEAERIYLEGLSIAEEAYGPRHHWVAKLLNDLGNAVGVQGDWRRAEQVHRRCLDILVALLGPEHMHVGRATAGLANDLLEQGDLAGAERAFAEALRIQRAKLPPGHDLTALATLGLGRVRLAQGRRGEAGPLLREAYGVLREQRGAGAPETALAALALSESLGAAGAAEAAPLLRESREALRAARGGADPLVARLGRALERR